MTFAVLLSPPTGGGKKGLHFVVLKTTNYSTLIMHQQQPMTNLDLNVSLTHTQRKRGH